MCLCDSYYNIMNWLYNKNQKNIHSPILILDEENDIIHYNQMLTFGP